MAERADKSTIFDGMHVSSDAAADSTTVGYITTHRCAIERPGLTASLRQIIERHRPQPERQVRLEMQRRDDLAHRQFCYVRQRMREQAERGGAGPGFFQHDVLKMKSHQFANPRASIDMRNDL